MMPFAFSTLFKNDLCPLKTSSNIEFVSNSMVSLELFFLFLFQFLSKHNKHYVQSSCLTQFSEWIKFRLNFNKIKSLSTSLHADSALPSTHRRQWKNRFTNTSQHQFKCKLYVRFYRMIFNRAHQSYQFSVFFSLHFMHCDIYPIHYLLLPIFLYLFFLICFALLLWLQLWLCVLTNNHRSNFDR